MDKIRGTAVAPGEIGLITQHIGASSIPIGVIKRVCGPLLEKLRVKITIPGLLTIDTPGHEAFITLRKRGGGVADLAILVIDVNEGFKPQTDESLNFLKQFKTPFVVAATKIDLIPGWYAYPTTSFTHSFEKQRPDVRDELERRVYQIVTQLAERGFESERFDRVEDFKRQVAIVPTSGVTGEGISELLMVLVGLAQQFLREKLKVAKLARGTVLEVKETVGLGTTVDLVLYDGEVRVGDWMAIGGKQPVTTRVRALLRPPALRELRVEKRFERVRRVAAAAGIKIAAPDLDRVIPGSPVIFVPTKRELDAAIQTVQREVEEVEFTREIEGVIARADTLGSLEALIKMLSDRAIPIRRAEVGKVTREDILDVQTVKDELRRVVIAFHTTPLKEAASLAADLRIPIFQNKVIYRLLEDYEKWCWEERERRIQEKLRRVTRPCRIRLLGKDYVFRVSKPAIFGVEVVAGVVRPRVRLARPDGRVIGEVKQIQSAGEAIPEAKTGDRVAISIEGITVGRQISETDILTSVISREDVKVLREVWDRLQADEKDLLKELELV